jgi:hypothetical protein
MHRRSACLVIRKDQAIRNHDILPSACRKHYNLSNIFWSQRLAATFIVSQHKDQTSDEDIRLTSTQHPPWTYLHQTSPSRTQSQPDQDPRT